MTDQPRQDAKVSQRAREAAAAWAKSNSRHAQAANILRGSCDTAPLVKLFARFEAATIERCAGALRGHLRLAADGSDLTGSYHRNHTIRVIETAIRNLKGATS